MSVIKSDDDTLLTNVYGLGIGVGFGYVIGYDRANNRPTYMNIV